MTEKPLNEYIDLEAYDVVTGDQYRALQARVAEAERERDDEITNRWKLEARVARLEEALRVIEESTAGMAGVSGIADIARRALGT